MLFRAEAAVQIHPDIFYFSIFSPKCQFFFGDSKILSMEVRAFSYRFCAAIFHKENELPHSYASARFKYLISKFSMLGFPLGELNAQPKTINAQSNDR